MFDCDGAAVTFKIVGVAVWLFKVIDGVRVTLMVDEGAVVVLVGRLGMIVSFIVGDGAAVPFMAVGVAVWLFSRPEGERVALKDGIEV